MVLTWTDFPHIMQMLQKYKKNQNLSNLPDLTESQKNQMNDGNCSNKYQKVKKKKKSEFHICIQITALPLQYQPSNRQWIAIPLSFIPSSIVQFYYLPVRCVPICVYKRMKHHIFRTLTWCGILHVFTSYRNYNLSYITYLLERIVRNSAKKST